jgi:hypothetical protein
MPVKIKHKQLDKIEIVTYINWANNYNHQLWDVLEMWDVGKVYNVQGEKPTYQSTVDKQDFLDAMKHPVNQNALRFEELPSIGKRFRIGTSKRYTIKNIKAIINSCLSIFKRDYIKLVIIGLLVLLIWFFIYPFLKSYFGHS